ncbi:MAG: DUF389 domain-containing protein [Bacteroidia bacterium]|nr:DUF389 domain-containing protein [Bacteroidia bacterium]
MTNPSEEKRNTPKADPASPASEAEMVKSQLSRNLGLLWRILTILPGFLWKLLMLVADLTETTDKNRAINAIKEGIKIKGYNMWILGASAVIACIGLDQDSVAVIIGAMLISPLMSPILGIGLSVGMYDKDTLRDSLKNFLIAICLSLTISTIYFWITPLGELTPQLAARTKPNLLDVGVAFFGGVAGIVAGSRKDITNAIPGVAIATALMPPVCTAGFGLAHFNMGVFFGAFYLFFLNAVFIALSTFLMVRFLDFPLVQRISSNFLRRIFGVVTVFVLIIVVPSVILLVQLVKEHSQKRNVETFVKMNFGAREGTKVMGWEYQPTDSTNYLRITLAGDFIPQPEIDTLAAHLSDHNFKNTSLKVVQTKFDPTKLNEYDSEMEQVRQIVELNNEQDERQQIVIDSLLKLLGPARDTVPFADLKKEIKSLYPELRKFSLTKMASTDFQNKDETHLTAVLKWDKSVKDKARREKEKTMREFLVHRLGVDTMYVMHFD